MQALVRPLAASLAAQALAAFTALTPPVFAVAAAPDLGIAATSVGVFTALLFLSAMLSATAGGGLVDSLGPIRTTQICSLLCAAGIALTATALLPLAALGGLVVGLGYGPMTPVSSHMLAQVTSERSRPFVFSLKQTSVPIGGVLAGLVIPVLTAEYGWRAAALCVAALGVAVALALEPLRLGLDGPAHPDRLRLRLDLGTAWRTVQRNPRLRALGLVSFVYSAMQLCLGTYLVTFLAEDVGLALVQAGLVLSAAQGAGIAGRLLWGAMAERVISARRLLAALGLVMSVAAALTGLFTAGWPLGAMVAVGILFGVSAVGWNGIYLAEIVRVTSPEQSARATGGVLFFTFGGMMAGPALFGAIVGAAGFSAAFFAVAAMTLVPGVLLLRREPLAETGPERPFRT